MKAIAKTLNTPLNTPGIFSKFKSLTTVLSTLEIDRIENASAIPVPQKESINTNTMHNMNISACNEPFIVVGKNLRP